MSVASCGSYYAEYEDPDPSPKISISTAVIAAVKAECAQCHAAGQPPKLITADDISGNSSRICNVIASRRMPPNGFKTRKNRDAIGDGLACGKLYTYYPRRSNVLLLRHVQIAFGSRVDGGVHLRQPVLPLQRWVRSLDI